MTSSEVRVEEAAPQRNSSCKGTEKPRLAHPQPSTANQSAVEARRGTQGPLCQAEAWVARKRETVNQIGLRLVLSESIRIRASQRSAEEQ